MYCTFFRLWLGGKTVILVNRTSCWYLHFSFWYFSSLFLLVAYLIFFPEEMQKLDYLLYHFTTYSEINEFCVPSFKYDMLVKPLSFCYLFLYLENLHSPVMLGLIMFYLHSKRNFYFVNYYCKCWYDVSYLSATIL